MQPCMRSKHQEIQDAPENLSNIGLMCWKEEPEELKAGDNQVKLPQSVFIISAL